MKRLMDDSELPLYSLELFFATTSVLYDEGFGDAVATFDLLVRDRPPKRNFLIAGGLEAIILFLENLKFTEDQVQHLVDKKRVSKGYADYLRKLSFTGTVYALPEGTVHFPGETLVRVTAPLAQANIITDQLIGLATVDTLYLSKLARLRIAGGDAGIPVGHIRAPGIDAGWRVSRCTQFFENMSFSNAAVAKRLGEDSSPIIVGNHSFVKSFKNELEAMRAITEKFTFASPMIDTYDSKQGIKNAIQVADELKARGQKLFGITVDSGDVLEISRLARQELDKAGHKDVIISIAGNLDEYKIAELVKNKIPARAFLAVTEVVTSADSPKLEMVYKLAQLEKGSEIQHTAKFAPEKISTPGVKQVYRTYDSKGKIASDYIGLEEEDLGEPLLVPVFNKGERVYKVPSLPETRAYVSKQLDALPDKYKDLDNDHEPPVVISDQLKSLLEEVRKKHASS